MKILISIPVEPYGSIQAHLVEWLLDVTMHPDVLGDGVEVGVVIARDKPTASCRNSQMKRFLETNADAIFCIDSDMIPRPEAVRYLMDHFGRDDVDVLCGIAHQKTKGGPMPVLYKFGEHGAKTDADLLDKNPDFGPFEMVEGGTGAACMLIKRRAVERFHEDGVVWFKDVLYEDPTHPKFGRRQYGHDAWFFLRCHDYGLRCWIDTRAHFGHVKPGDLLDEASRLHRERLGKETLHA